jgi:cell division GTPase FtsZ
MSHDCVFTGMSIEPRDLFEIKLNTLEGNLMSSFITDMVVVKSEKLVYTVTNKLTITAYSYADNELKKLVGKDLDYSNDPTEGNVDNAAVFALMQDESALYLFSKKGTYLIETKTILEKMYVY